MKLAKKKMNVGVGFVTGRKNFKDVVKTYVYNWAESSVVENPKAALHLFVAYDLAYCRTKISDYKIIDEEILDVVDSASYIGKSLIVNEIQYLVEKKVISRKEAQLIFGEGYGKKRNIVLYFAIKNRMDYLIFLDDDEYPVAVVELEDGIAWQGQEVLATHISNIQHVDMTHGYHCGYISPIPYMEFNEKLSEDEFRLFIESISNDIISWDSIKKKMNDGGITYADPTIIKTDMTKAVEEVNGMKFISGANLGFNLKNTNKIFPFYNPPGARGEDTFLSASIGQCKVAKIPCYTFHDGFGIYEHVSVGVLPKKLERMKQDGGKKTKRFLKASIGWIRYKPLLLYITQREQYEEEILKIKENLTAVLPKICDYFGTDEFQQIMDELDYYDAKVDVHFQELEQTRLTWCKILQFLRNG